MKRTICILTALLTAVVFCACGSSNESYYSGAQTSNTASYAPSYNGKTEDYYYDGDMPMEMEMPEAFELGDYQAEAPSQRKIIKNYSANIQTLEYDNAIAGLQEMVEKSHGYVEASSHNGQGAIDYGRRYARNANYTLRIPAGESDNFVAALSNLGAVTNSNQGIDDVTDYYYDIDAHLSALRAQETRLLELLAQADSVDTMITIEQALSDVRYQIESLEGTIRRLDSQIAYSTVQLYIEEVFRPEDIQIAPMTLGERIRSRFHDSIDQLQEDGEDFLVWLIGDSLIIAVWVLTIIALIFVYKKVFKKLIHRSGIFERKPGKRARKKAEQQALTETEMPKDDKAE